MDVFKRSAEGFDDIVVAMVKANQTAEVLDFSEECADLTPILVYPPSMYFPIGVSLSNTKVFIDAATSDSVFAFKCAA